MVYSYKIHAKYIERILQEFAKFHLTYSMADSYKILAKYNGKILQEFANILHGRFLRDSCQVLWKNLARICQVLPNISHGRFLRDSCQVPRKNLVTYSIVDSCQGSCQVTWKNLARICSSTEHIPWWILARVLPNTSKRSCRNLQDSCQVPQKTLVMYSMANSYKNLDKYPSEESCKNLSSSTYYSIVDLYKILAKHLDESSMNVSTFTHDKFLQDSWKNLARICLLLPNAYIL